MWRYYNTIMSVAYDQLRRLVAFKNSPKALSDYLREEKAHAGNATIPTPVPPFTKDELAHEAKHAAIWHEKNIGTTFGRDSDGFPFTAPNLDDVEAWVQSENVTKEEFLDRLLRVAKAPSNK